MILVLSLLIRRFAALCDTAGWQAKLMVNKTCTERKLDLGLSDLLHAVEGGILF